MKNAKINTELNIEAFCERAENLSGNAETCMQNVHKYIQVTR
jgi:hypothetical protein